MSTPAIDARSGASSANRGTTTTAVQPDLPRLVAA